MLKDLFFPVTGAASEDVVLRSAAEVATAYEAKLIVSVPSPSLTPLDAPWGVAQDPFVTSLLGQLDVEAQERAEALRSLLHGAQVDAEVRVDVTHYMEPAVGLSHKARFADLSIMARPFGSEDAIAHAFFASFLTGSGRPVLVLPVEQGARRFRKAVLAWKPTREATRALHDALALFSPETIEVLVVDPAEDPDEGDADSSAEIATHLARHGVKANVASSMSAGTNVSVATAILLHAAESEADLVIAGGYGHARLREWMLGGATRELLQALELPVLFSH